jgi:hypothetical protein
MAPLYGTLASMVNHLGEKAGIRLPILRGMEEDFWRGLGDEQRRFKRVAWWDA